jgi:hypothetical protein
MKRVLRPDDLLAFQPHASAWGSHWNPHKPQADAWGFRRASLQACSCPYGTATIGSGQPRVLLLHLLAGSSPRHQLVLAF